ncbi:MAG TPA: carbohydrate ABC transporter permease [Thermoflexales bacterium]|nr:carbohydrate ABC transporter permease [Thermoflexales bacterium]
MKKISTGRQILSQLALAGVGLFVAAPLLNLLGIAFDDSLQGPPLEFHLLPRQFGLAGFTTAWESPAQGLPFVVFLKNSLFIAGGAAVLAVILGISLAYAFARMRFAGKRVGLFALLVGSLLPPIALIVPQYVLLTRLGVRGSQLGLMAVYTAIAMPFCVWNMRAAFLAVPSEVEEAAMVDGADAKNTLWRITLPLALPSIGVAALIAFLVGYSEYTLAWLLIDKGENVTLAMALSNALGQYTVSWNILSALAVMMTAPVVVIFLVLQKFLLDSYLFHTGLRQE